MRCLLSFVLLSALVTVGCAGNPAAPSTAATSATPSMQMMDYTINVPTSAVLVAMRTAYPNGVLMAPVAAQQQFDYTTAYHGSPNVYAGETAPALGTYPGASIVVAPYAAASAPTFTSAQWPLYPAGVTYQWHGTFALAVPRS